MKAVYCNPVTFSDGAKHTNPDPFIMRWCGTYYCYATDEAGVKVSTSEDLVHWTFLGYAISEEEYHHYWAPSVIYLDGIFYMYYSNIPAREEDCHEQHLKLAVSENPLGPFVYRKTFFEKFSIDAHPVLWNGELYLFYSVNDWIGLESEVAGTCILLDKMVSPEKFEGNPRPVILPTLRQEMYAENRFGDGRDWYTIEGACPVPHGKKCWLLYSANAYENVDYFVGTTVAEKKESLLEMQWKKYPDNYTWLPLLKKNGEVEGTGHNTTAKAPDLFGDWIVYHGRDVEEGLCPGTEQRTMRIDPLLFFGNRMFCPGPSRKERLAPGKGFYSRKDLRIEGEIFFTEAKLYYRMELWWSAVLTHAGAKYTVYLDYADAGNFIGLEIDCGHREIRAVGCTGGILSEYGHMPLWKDIHFQAPHLLAVQRKKHFFQIMLDDRTELEFFACAERKCGEIGVSSAFSTMLLQSLTVSEGAELSGKELALLPDFYHCSQARLRKGGLEGGMKSGMEGGKKDGMKDGMKGRLEGASGQLHFEEKESRFGVEIFEFEVTSAKNGIVAGRGEKACLIMAEKGKDTVTVYHCRQEGKECFITDGKTGQDGDIFQEISGISFLCAEKQGYLKEERFTLHAEGLCLWEYAFYNEL